MRRRGAPRQRGFSLLEVLVAFVILSLVATALFRLFSGALVNASAADDYTHAVLVAESALTEAAAAVPLVETTADRPRKDGSPDDARRDVFAPGSRWI
jgi:general secretion pathway protein I